MSAHVPLASPITWDTRNITGTTPNTCGTAWDMSRDMVGEQLDIKEIMFLLFFPRISWDAMWPMGHWWDSVCGRVDCHECNGRGAVEARA
jgi:hypothetical protein